MKFLKYSKIFIDKFRSSGDAQLQVHFLDPAGEDYKWVPAWGDMLALLDKAANTEAFNFIRSADLERFAAAVKNILEKSKLVVSEAERFYGRFTHVSGGCMVIHADTDRYTETRLWRYPPVFPLTEEFLDAWLEKDVEGLIVNGFIVRIGLQRHEIARSSSPQY